MPTIQNTFKILKNGKVSMVLAAMLTSSVLLPTDMFAAPQGGNVAAGTATINQSGSTTTINQTSGKAVVNWNSFSVGKNEVVNFNQPNKNSVTLNRVVGNSQSVIDGMINANGQVFISNPNGILISKTGSINTAGFLATTKSITDSDFMNGNYKFTTNDASAGSSVINIGTINISNGGYAILAGNSVANEGSITAIKGKIHLVGADEYTINLNGNSLVSLRVDKSTVDALVSNSGALIADGGEVYLTTNSANELLKSVVNNTGIIRAQTIDEIVDGTEVVTTGKIEIYAHGGTANISGTLDASAATKGNGGFIETSGKTVNIANNTLITTKAENGSNGTWLIDPVDFTIASSGGNMTGTSLSSNLANNSVIIQSSSGTTGTNGDIYVNDAISWSANNTLTLSAYRNIYINSLITGSGTSSKVALQYGQGAVNSGNTASYNFGLTSVSSSETGNNFSGQIKLSSGSNFSTKLGSDGATTNYTVINNQTDLAAISLSGNYVLGSNISLSGAWTPLGDSTTQFSGIFDGLGHTVSNISVSSSVTNSGLFGYTNASSIIRNVGVSGGTVGGSSSAGGLVGLNNGKIYNAYATATINGNNGIAGGLAGINNGTIYNAYATGSVSSDGSSTGGLVGSNSSTIYNTFATGSVTNNGGFVDGGGLVGTNTGSIANSYATGSVTGDYNNNGGLVGLNGGAISKSYSTGTTSGASATNGGFVGDNSLGTITDSFWDTTTSATSTAVGSGSSTGVTGKVTSDMKNISTYSGASWDIVGSETLYPTLTFGAGTNSAKVWNVKTAANFNVPGTSTSSSSTSSASNSSATSSSSTTTATTNKTTTTTTSTTPDATKTYKKMLVLNGNGTTTETTMSPEQAHILMEQYNQVLKSGVTTQDLWKGTVDGTYSGFFVANKDANSVTYVSKDSLTDMASRLALGELGKYGSDSLIAEGGIYSTQTQQATATSVNKTQSQNIATNQYSETTTDNTNASTTKNPIDATGIETALIKPTYDNQTSAPTETNNDPVWDTKTANVDSQPKTSGMATNINDAMQASATIPVSGQENSSAKTPVKPYTLDDAYRDFGITLVQYDEKTRTVRVGLDDQFAKKYYIDENNQAHLIPNENKQTPATQLLASDKPITSTAVNTNMATSGDATPFGANTVSSGASGDGILIKENAASNDNKQSSEALINTTESKSIASQNYSTQPSTADTPYEVFKQSDVADLAFKPAQTYSGELNIPEPQTAQQPTSNIIGAMPSDKQTLNGPTINF